MKMFRNDDDRRDWIDGYRGGQYADAWKIWVEYPLIDRRFWKAELAGCTFVHEERLQTVTNPFTEPKTQVKWTTCGGYILPLFTSGLNHPLEDYKASKTMMLNKIKELEKA